MPHVVKDRWIKPPLLVELDREADALFAEFLRDHVLPFRKYIDGYYDFVKGELEKLTTFPFRLLNLAIKSVFASGKDSKCRRPRKERP